MSLERIFKLPSIELVVIILISIFFRFYRFADFHYWGGDEEVLTATIRHIIWDRSPTLLVQNASLGFGLGPFYHYFLAIWYWLFDFRLVLLQSIGSILGVITTVILYFGGKELGGKKVGLLTALFYASSFFIALFDRRVVHLTLNPFLSALTFLLLAQAVKRNFRLLPLLALPIGFAFHEDASLLVLVVAIFVTWICFRIPFKHVSIYKGLVLLCIFFIPLGLAEIRYKGAVIKPFITSLTRPLTGQTRKPYNYQIYSPITFINVLGRVIATQPATQAEEYFAYTLEFPLPLFSPLPQVVALSIILGGLVYYLIKRDPVNPAFTVLWILTGSFIFGALVFNLVFKENFYQHYFMVYFPIFILASSYLLSLVLKRQPLFLYLVLAIYIGTNVYTLVNSQVKYPLKQKLALVDQALVDIGKDKFSIYASGDPYVQGGGWTELFTLKKHPAVKSYWYDFWSWIYASYSLYPTAIQDVDPEKIVVVRKADEQVSTPGKLLSTHRYKDLLIEVLVNED